MFEYIWLLLPLGLLIGWLAAKRDNVKKQKILRYLNLRYFIEESQQVDESLLTLPPDFDADNLNFSLMLGDVFRKRGEIDKAINLHEYLIKEAPTKELTEKVYLSLAEDYLAAGMLDRGEGTLRLLLESGIYKNIALKKLTKVYKQQREWLQSIAMLEQISPMSPDLLAEMAHLYCELAEETLFSNDSSSLQIDRLMLWLEKAYAADKNCVRATLIRAFALYDVHNYESSLEVLLEVERQEQKLVPIIISMVYELSVLLGKPQFFHEWLDTQIGSNPHILLKVWKAHYLIFNESFDSGIAYLQSALKRESNLLGLMILNQLQKYHLGKMDAILIEKTFRDMLDRYAQFQCDSCGYTTKAMQWSCPSCFEWNKSIPVQDIVALKVKHV